MSRSIGKFGRAGTGNFSTPKGILRVVLSILCFVLRTASSCRHFSTPKGILRVVSRMTHGYDPYGQDFSTPKGILRVVSPFHRRQADVSDVGLTTMGRWRTIGRPMVVRPAVRPKTTGTIYQRNRQSVVFRPASILALTAGRRQTDTEHPASSASAQLQAAWRPRPVVAPTRSPAGHGGPRPGPYWPLFCDRLPG